MVNSRSLPVFLIPINWWPFLFTHLVMSSSEAGSSAVIFRIFPTAILSISIFVLKTGSGQNIPRTSIVLVGVNSEISVTCKQKSAHAILKSIHRHKEIGSPKNHWQNCTQVSFIQNCVILIFEINLVGKFCDQADCNFVGSCPDYAVRV